jgi:hypothetical protein
MNMLDEILENQHAWQALSADDEITIRVVALEALTKCADSIAVLSGNLRNIGYSWVTSENIPSDVLEKNIRVIETKMGLSIPMILVEFWKLVGGVSFIDLENYRHTDFWEARGIRTKNGFADGLHVETCNDEWTAFICDDYIDWKENFTSDESDGFILSLSPDGYHKDNISGGASYGVSVESSWKPIWKNFEWSGEMQPVTALANPPDLLSYLRTTILECAGFPALLGIPAFESIKESLLRGVPVF